MPGSRRRSSLPRLKSSERSSRSKKRSAVVLGLEHEFHCVAAAQGRDDALLRARMKKPVEQIAQAAVGNFQPEMPRRHAFKSVRLVEDHEVVMEKITALLQFALRAGEEIEEERVIEHQDLGHIGLLARALVKAFRAQAAGARRADVRLAANLEPDRRIRRRDRDRRVCRRVCDGSIPKCVSSPPARARRTARRRGSSRVAAAAGRDNSGDLSAAPP